MRDHQKAHNKISSLKKNNLTTYVTMEDSSKTTGFQLRVACERKHPLDKCESITEKPLNEKIKILRKRKLCYERLKPKNRPQPEQSKPRMLIKKCSWRIKRDECISKRQV